MRDSGCTTLTCKAGARRGAQVRMRRLFAGLSLLVMAAASPAAQGTSAQYDVKAVFLYNFLRYIEWPSRPATGPIVLCVVGLERVAQVVADTVKEEQIDGRPIKVDVIHEPMDGCHMVFAPLGVRTERYAPPPRGTVTVSEVPGFLKAGGIINFVLVDGRVRFEISPEAAERAEVRISSRLLRLRHEPDGAAR